MICIVKVHLFALCVLKSKTGDVQLALSIFLFASKSSFTSVPFIRTAIGFHYYFPRVSY